MADFNGSSSEEEDYCETCDREFVCRAALLSHLSHSSCHPFYCAPCDRDFHYANSFRTHLASKRHAKSCRDVVDDCEEEEVSCYCKTCDREFVSRTALLSHLSHSSRHPFYCVPCHREFVSRAALLAHLSHSSRHPFYCAPCFRDFQDANSFRFHLASKRHKNPFIFCPKCNSGFVSAAGLVKHVEMSRCYAKPNKQIVDAVRRWEQITENPNLFTVPHIACDNNCEENPNISTVPRVRCDNNCEENPNISTVPCVGCDNNCEENPNISTVPRVGCGNNCEENLNISTVPRVGCDNNCEEIISSRTFATEASFDGKSYICPICTKGFQTLMSLDQHLGSNVHDASEFHCRKCSRKFKASACACANCSQCFGIYATCMCRVICASCACGVRSMWCNDSFSN